MEQDYYNESVTTEQRSGKPRYIYAQKKGYQSVCSFANGSAVACYDPKQIDAQPGDEGFEMLGECAEGSKVASVGKLILPEGSMKIQPFGSNSRFNYKLAGYVRVKDDPGFVALLKNVFLTRLLIIIAAVLVVVALVVGAILIFGGDKNPEGTPDGSKPDSGNTLELDPGAVEWEGTLPRNTGGVTKGIAIPGYESITIDADKTDVVVNFLNPADNECYFVISLILTDSNEVIYKSKHIAPDMGIHDIQLTRPLTAGTYNAIVKYETFSIEGLHPMNGAEVNIKLIAEAPNP